jgi:hypothetical protein
VAKKPVTGESAKETVKTIVQGMPDETGEPVVTTRVLSTLHTRLRVHRTPGIPCALSSEEGNIYGKLGRIAPREGGRLS